MTRNSWIIFAVICAAVVGGLIWTSNGNKANLDDIDVDVVQTASEENGNIADHTLGNPDAKVVVINYSDYQCPGCAAANPVMKEIADKYEDDIMLIFRNFAFLQPNSRAAAAAAEAAGLQGKFWEMNGQLYSSQNEWNQASLEARNTIFTGYANQLGLDIEKFESDVTSEAVSQKINHDKAIAGKVGVTGTPSIYVNGKAASASYKDGEIVPDRSEGSRAVWSSAELFEKHMILPALKDAGVTVEK